MLKLLASYNKRTEGQVTILFALAFVPILLAAGAAIDHVRIDNAKTQMQAALDGAALAAAMAEDRTNAQREILAKSYFKANFTDATSYTFGIKVNATSVSASANLSWPNSFMRLAGIATSEIDVTTEVMRPTINFAEIAMVLDYSGSMKDSDKYIRMSAAASQMVDSLSAALPAGKLKIGLVPFSAMVYTSMPASYVTQGSWSSTWTGCTQDRTYPNNLTVDTPTSSSATKWGYYDTGFENSGIYGCSAYQTNNLAILPLSADMAAVKSKLSTMKPVGNTNIPLGAEFGWNLLDPQAPYTQAAPYTDTNTRKYLILLTDGVQTSTQSGSGGTRTVENGNSNLTDLCNAIDKKKITIFAIAYDITDSAVTKLLKGCAKDNYYEPDVGGSEISNVFSSITKEIKNQMVRLSR
jgi:Flp pilus assembly protein TadG